MAGVSAALVLTTFFASEKLQCIFPHHDDHECTGVGELSWNTVFTPLYIVYGLLYLSTLLPLCAYRAAYYDTNYRLTVHGKPITAKDVTNARNALEGETVSMVVGLVQTTLLLIITLTTASALEDSRRHTFTAPLALIIALFSIVFLVGVIIASISKKNISASTLFICCKKHSLDHGATQDEYDPACLRSSGSSTGALFYTIGIILFLALLILSTALIVAIDNLVQALIPLWIGATLYVATSLQVILYTSSASYRPYELATVVTSNFVVVMLVLFSILALNAEQIGAQILFAPLYVAFGFSTIVFSALFFFHANKRPAELPESSTIMQD